MSRLSFDMGVPLSLLQGTPTPFTVDGRPGLLESPWTERDVAVALAVQQQRDEQCPGCGGDLQLTTDPEHQFDWTAEAVRCHNCKARADEADGFDDRSGLLVRSRFDVDERYGR